MGPHKVLFLVGILVVAVVATATVHQSRRSQHPPQTSISIQSQIKNETEHLLVISAALVPEHFTNGETRQALQYTLKNTSDKAITALTVMPLDSIRMTVDFLFTETEADGRIKPGAEYSETYPVSQSIDWTTPEPKFTILAAIFEDGSSEGNFEVTRIIRTQRAGFKAELARVIPLFQELLDLTAPARHSALGQIKKRVRTLQAGEEVKDGDHFKIGVRDARDFVLSRFERLESLKAADPERLERDLNYSKRILEKMHSRL